jgi:hypothetical protein
LGPGSCTRHLGHFPLDPRISLVGSQWPDLPNVNSANAGLPGVGSLAALGGWGPITVFGALVGRGRNATGLPPGGGGKNSRCMTFLFCVLGMGDQGKGGGEKWEQICLA